MKDKIFESEIITSDYLGHGASGTVFTCEYKGKQYAYKELTCDDRYKEFIQPRLETISRFYGDSNFVLPYKFVYNNPSDKLFSGYIMDYAKNYTELCELNLTYKEKLHILHKARKLLDKLHSEYKHLHTDINPWNFSYNKDNDEVILMDFDTCIDLSKKDSISIDHLNDLARIYCKYKGTDTDLDIFMFNLLTFSILNDVKFYDVIDHIFDDNYGCIESHRSIEILKDYKDIEYNTLKKEYVIDHL